MLSLNEIQAAARRLEGVAIRTPLHTNAELDRRVGATCFLKCENLQHIGAFKFRGAYNRLVQLNEDERARGVVAFSSGNHAQGIAYAAALLNMQATIVMPSDAPAVKRKGAEALGATIRDYDRYWESREQIAADIAAETGGVLVPAFDDFAVMAGQGTCGIEIIGQLQQLGKAPDAVLSPVGGGGLMAGVATAVKGLRENCAVIGVEPEGYDDHVLSRAAGKRVQLTPKEATICDSLMASIPGELTWETNSRLVDSFLSVSEDEVAQAVSFAFRYLKLVVEPGGAVGLAALLSKKFVPEPEATVAIVLSGGNIDPEVHAALLSRFPTP